MGTCGYCYDTIDSPDIVGRWGDHLKCDEENERRRTAGLCVYCGKDKDDNGNDVTADGYHDGCASVGEYVGY